jgi:hypothetical protein
VLKILEMTVYAVNDDAFLGIPYNAKKEKKKLN